mmetsp:Transcript_23202/g.61167  ORF Transcript_23202/g.61167 Transcript_23202/m.61167 type:complete len:307 (-) Transcript_23202:69-989(-)
MFCADLTPPTPHPPPPPPPTRHPPPPSTHPTPLPHPRTRCHPSPVSLRLPPDRYRRLPCRRRHYRRSPRQGRRQRCRRACCCQLSSAGTWLSTTPYVRTTSGARASRSLLASACSSERGQPWCATTRLGCRACCSSHRSASSLARSPSSPPPPSPPSFTSSPSRSIGATAPYDSRSMRPALSHSCCALAAAPRRGRSVTTGTPPWRSCDAPTATSGRTAQIGPSRALPTASRAPRRSPLWAVVVRCYASRHPAPSAYRPACAARRWSVARCGFPSSRETSAATSAFGSRRWARRRLCSASARAEGS